MPHSVEPSDTSSANLIKAWIFVGAAALAATAGYINTVMLGFFAVPVSHMSGAVAHLGVDLAVPDGADLMTISSIVGGFLFGAFVSGVLIGNATLRPGRRYGVALILEGVVLLVATFLAIKGNIVAVPLAAFACGLQNAMASSYRGLVLRTTHVTGVVTDIGTLLGNRLRGRHIQSWKLLLLATLLLAFFIGGVMGALAVTRVGMMALAPAGMGCLLAGFGYTLYLYLTHPGRSSGC